MSEKVSRRGILGGLLGGLAWTLGANRLPAQPAVLWEEPEEDESDLPPLDEEDEEESTSTFSSSISWSSNY